MTPVERKIIELLCHFDVLSRPLTRLEIAKWLAAQATWQEAEVALSSLAAAGRIEVSQGFYMLAGRSELVALRLDRYAASLPKLERAWRWASRLRHLPWVRAIAIYSSVSFYNAKPDSDLDIFVVAASGRLWSCRFFLNAALKLLRLRPTARRKADTLCVSFLVDESALDLRQTLEGDDRYYLYGTSQFIFLYEASHISDAFFAANPWIADQLPQWRPYRINAKRTAGRKRPWIGRLGEMIAGICPESRYRELQLRILPQRYRDLAGDGTRVIISDTMIKLHDRDGRQDFNRQFALRLNEAFSEHNA